MAVQLGFVTGTFLLALANLADLLNTRRMFAACSLLAGLPTTASIRLWPVVQGAAGWGVAFALLALGPICGTAAMLLLPSLPEALAPHTASANLTQRRTYLAQPSAVEYGDLGAGCYALRGWGGVDGTIGEPLPDLCLLVAIPGLVRARP